MNECGRDAGGEFGERLAATGAQDQVVTSDHIVARKIAETRQGASVPESEPLRREGNIWIERLAITPEHRVDVAEWQGPARITNVDR